MAGRTPVPRIQSEPQGWRPSAAPRAITRFLGATTWQNLRNQFWLEQLRRKCAPTGANVVAPSASEVSGNPYARVGLWHSGAFR